MTIDNSKCAAAAFMDFTHHVILIRAHVELSLTRSEGSLDLKEPFQRCLGPVSVKKSEAHADNTTCDILSGSWYHGGYQSWNTSLTVFRECEN
jgi:hypothetical protein